MIGTTLAGLVWICDTPPPIFLRQFGGKPLVQRWIHSNCRFACVAAALLLLGSAGGCAVWNKDSWNPNNYRDARAADIDKRLDQSGPAVQSPF